MKLMIGLLAWPLTEIALFVLVGGQVGVWGVLALVLATGVLGGLVIRLTAARQAVALQGGLRGLRVAEVSGGVLGLLAGVLLILPGFLTDALGLLLLLPPVQALILRRLAGQRAATPAAEPWREGVVDADYIELDRDGQPRRPTGQPTGQPSRWSDDAP